MVQFIEKLIQEPYYLVEFSFLSFVKYQSEELEKSIEQLEKYQNTISEKVVDTSRLHQLEQEFEEQWEKIREEYGERGVVKWGWDQPIEKKLEIKSGMISTIARKRRKDPILEAIAEIVGNTTEYSIVEKDLSWTLRRNDKKKPEAKISREVNKGRRSKDKENPLSLLYYKDKQVTIVDEAWKQIDLFREIEKQLREERLSVYFEECRNEGVAHKIQLIINAINEELDLRELEKNLGYKFSREVFYSVDERVKNKDCLLLLGRSWRKVSNVIDDVIYLSGKIPSLARDKLNRQLTYGLKIPAFPLLLAEDSHTEWSLYMARSLRDDILATESDESDESDEITTSQTTISDSFDSRHSRNAPEDTGSSINEIHHLKAPVDSSGQSDELSEVNQLDELGEADRFDELSEFDTPSGSEKSDRSTFRENFGETESEDVFDSVLDKLIEAYESDKGELETEPEDDPFDDPFEDLWNEL